MPARFLIVDDEAAVRSLYARALELDGYETQAAATADEALTLIRTAPPDAILLDLKLPFIDGVGFLYRLRETHPRLPVAIITGMEQLDEATRDEIRSLGAELHYKPVRTTDLQSIARRLLTDPTH